MISEHLLQLQRCAPADEADLFQVGGAVDLLPPHRELHRVVGLPARSQRDEALIEPHAVLDGGLGLQIVVAVAGDQLDEALALLEHVDDRRAGHAEHAELRVLLPGFEDEPLHEPLALAHHGALLALLGVVDLVDDDEVDDVLVQEGDEGSLRVGLLELLEVEDEVARGAGERILPRRRPGLLRHLAPGERHRGQRRPGARAARALLHAPALRARSAHGAAGWPHRVQALCAAQGEHPPRHDADGAHGPSCDVCASPEDSLRALPRGVLVALVVARAGDAEAARWRSCAEAETEGARRFAVRALGLAVWFHTWARAARVARARAVPSLGSCERAGPAGGALSIRP